MAQSAFRFSLVVAAATVAGSASAENVLTNGTLTVTINEISGTIGAAVFDGVDYFNPGTTVSNFGFQHDETFKLNLTASVIGQPRADQPVTVTGTTVTSVISVDSTTIGFERTYSLVSDLNVLEVTTVLTNSGRPIRPGAEPTLLSTFDTFNPDQGATRGFGFETFNDVFNLAGGKVGQASIDSGTGELDTVILGSLDPRATIASGGPFQIGTRAELTNLLDSPID